MREILQSGARGISREELCSKWAVSSMNDYPGDEISERTFHRIRRLLEGTFQVIIECSKDGNKRYRLSAEDLTPGRPSLLDLVLFKAGDPANKENTDRDNTSSLQQIISILTAGSQLSIEDSKALEVVTSTVRRLPYECGDRLIKATKSGKIRFADCAEWDWDYKYYIMLWDEATFHHSRQWLSVGLCSDAAYFYIVSDEQDHDLRENRAVKVGAAEGVLYRRGYWWHEMKDPQLFRMPFNTVPDYDEIVRRSEQILSLLKKFE